MIDFLQSGSIGNVADTNSKLRYVVSPLETLGIWPSGDWLLGTHDFSHDWLYWLFGLIGLAGLVVGLVWWIGRRDYAVPAAVASGLVIYLVTKYIEDGGLYILAKAVVVPASVVMLLVVMALLAPGGGPGEAGLRRGLHRAGRVFVVPRPPRHGRGARPTAWISSQSSGAGWRDRRCSP